jgi:hypothetical protein
MIDYEQLKEALLAHLEVEMDINTASGYISTTIKFQGEKITEGGCWIPGVGYDDYDD